MSAPWPKFLRRILALQRARRAFLAEDLGTTLELLEDVDLELSEPAARLRRTTIERLARRAMAAASVRGSVGAGPDLEWLARFAPDQARMLRRAIEQASAPRPESRMAGLLAELRERSTRVARRAAAENNQGAMDHDEGTPEPDASRPAPDPERSTAPRARLFHLAVDDGGEFLVACGPRLVLGHLRSSKADLPFLADVEGEQAEITLEESFHGGERWHLWARPFAPVPRVGGLAIAAGGLELASGDRVELAHNLALRFHAHQVASSSALLELERGLECHGAQHVLLLGPGAGGRVRIGTRRQRLIRVADLEHEVEIELTPTGLVVRCDGGLRQGFLEVLPGRGANLQVPCPPPGVIELVVGARSKDRPPFMLLLRPVIDALGGRAA